jgi:hypothetical protein
MPTHLQQRFYQEEEEGQRLMYSDIPVYDSVRGGWFYSNGEEMIIPTTANNAGPRPDPAPRPGPASRSARGPRW